MEGDLKISFGDLSVVFHRFQGADRPRTRLQLGGSPTYTMAGNLVISGAAFELPMQYSVKAYINQPQKLILDAIWQESDTARRTPPYTGFELEIDDETELLVETAPRSRTEVAGTTVTTFATTRVAYYPRLQMVMPAPPVYATLGKEEAVSIFLVETGVKI